MLLAVYSLMQLFAAPLWGRLSDRVGRRPVLMVSMAASVLAYLWIGSATALWMLFAARALAGACAGNIAAAQAYIADITKPEDRAKGMGLIGAAFGLGFIIGPALGGLLAGPDPATADVQTPAWVAAGFSFVALCGVVLLLRESLPADRRGVGGPSRGRVSAILERAGPPRAVAPDPDLLLVILAFAAMESTFALWAIAQFGWGPAPSRICLLLCRRPLSDLAGWADRQADATFRRGAAAVLRSCSDRYRALDHAAGAQRAAAGARYQRAGARHGADAALAQQPDLAPGRARGAGRSAGRARNRSAASRACSARQPPGSSLASSAGMPRSSGERGWSPPPCWWRSS